MTPPPVGPTPRPDVRPVAPGTHLLFAQSGRIEHVPLDGSGMKKEEAKPLLHIPVRPDQNQLPAATGFFKLTTTSRRWFGSVSEGQTDTRSSD